MNIRFDVSEFDLAAAKFKGYPKAHELAKYRAANEVARKVRTQTVKDVRAAAGLKAGPVRKRSYLGRAKRRRPFANVWFGFGTGIPVEGNSARGASHPVPNPPSFLATMPSGHRGRFYRHPSKRMRNKPNRAAIYEVRADIRPHVLRYLPANSKRIWDRDFNNTYRRDVQRRLQNVRK